MPVSSYFFFKNVLCSSTKQTCKMLGEPGIHVIAVTTQLLIFPSAFSELADRSHCLTTPSRDPETQVVKLLLRAAAATPAK